MIKSVLIANRGEIAVRIIRTAKKLNIHTVVVYSEADADSLAVQMSDEAFFIGISSYLDSQKIIEIAAKAKVEAIHPGYGFLSENVTFARKCEEAGFIFIGPSPEALQKMGSKKEAKEIARELGIPVIPGYEGTQKSLVHEAEKIGYPLMIKAVMGGGGKGMRRVDSGSDFEQALGSCQREAIAAFGNGDVLLEKIIEEPRHIEVQIFGDAQGNLVHLFERDCSLQRRYQKVIEEAPSHLPNALKEKLYGAALTIGRAVNYRGAGTVEFLVDAQGQFYFMEMNTRLQVEHPVTEAITGLDLVEWQFRIASNEPLPLPQEQIPSHGHALELRLYAEDPHHNFKPVAGPLWMKETPPSIRIDTGFKQKDQVTPYYDPLIAKAIIKGNDRPDAFVKASESLDQFTILGVKTNISFLKNLIDDPSIRENHFDIGYIDRHLKRLAPPPSTPHEVFVAATLIRILSSPQHEASPWEESHNWRLTGFSPISMEWSSNGETKVITLTFTPEGWVQGMGKPMETQLIENTLLFSGKQIPYLDDMGKLSLKHEGETYSLSPIEFVPQDKKHPEYRLSAPMTGKVVLIHVKEGDRVKKGQPLVILEAMKMEHLINAPKNGIVKRLCYKIGDVVHEGTELIDLEESNDAA